MTLPFSPEEEWFNKVRNRGWAKFDRVSVAACALLGGLALAIAASLADWEMLFPSVMLGVAAAWLAALVALSVRLAVFGKLPPDVHELLPLRVVRAGIYWLVVKFGIVCASLYLILAAGLGLFLHWRMAFLVQGFALLAMAMMFGNFVQSVAVNICLAWRRRRELSLDPDI